MKHIPGVAIGIVKSLEDPEGMGRILLEFPWLSEESPESNWARIAVPMAGAERGMQFMPELGDEVLVAFDHGELRFPYVVGFLWNGQELPPRTEPAQRTIQTVSGHVLEFDDTEGSEKVTMKWKGGDPSITLEQTKLSIVFDGGNSIELSASGVKVQGTRIDLN